MGPILKPILESLKKQPAINPKELKLNANSACMIIALTIMIGSLFNPIM